MPSSEMMIIAGFALLLIVNFLLILVKDKETRQKFSKFELVIEGLIKENYELKKELEKLPKSQNEPKIELTPEIFLRIDEAVNLKIKPLINTVKNIENIIDDFQNDQQNRLFSLEERTNAFSKITPPSFDMEEKRIIELYENGKSVENIARDLGKSVGSINMVLKLHKII